MLLAGVDIEGCAADVVSVAGQLALDLGTPLTVVYAAQIPVGLSGEAILGGAGESVRERVLHEAEDTLRALAQPWSERGLAVTPVVRFGPPDDVVLGLMGELRPRMLVLGTHGRVGVARWLYGSVEESITRRCHLPVVVVPTAGAADRLTPTHAALLVEEDG